MKKPHLYFRAYLAALLMLAAVPAEAADVKELFAIDLEGPTDVHVVGRNASNTEPARFVVVLLKAKGAPILTPVKE